MIRFAPLMMLAGAAWAAPPPVDIDTAAKIYQAAEIREQVRASLGSMPVHVREMLARDVSAKLSDEQLAAVTAAAERGFRIDVFEAPALVALAQHLDTSTVTKSLAFLGSDLGKRMVGDDVAVAQLGDANIDKVMGGELAPPTTAKRDALIDRLERATRSTESTVQVFLSMGEAVAVGTAIGSGLDRKSIEERVQKSGEANRAELEESMRVPMRRFLAYAYRDLSDADLKHLLAFLESPPGVRYVTAYNASMGAGYDAMGRRTGEHLGESLRELAQAQLDASPANRVPSEINPSPDSLPPAPAPRPERP
ncbi:MAG TPA: DUF2059 domain-containing protein [Steroidobacteraceae bacterium]|nr:DUF2059 domain-containing protein [Steroidobacteraceae bacterium]